MTGVSFEISDKLVGYPPEEANGKHKENIKKALVEYFCEPRLDFLNISDELNEKMKDKDAARVFLLKQLLKYSPRIDKRGYSVQDPFTAWVTKCRMSRNGVITLRYNFKSD